MGITNEVSATRRNAISQRDGRRILRSMANERFDALSRIKRKSHREPKNIHICKAEAFSPSPKLAIEVAEKRVEKTKSR